MGGGGTTGFRGPYASLEIFVESLKRKVVSILKLHILMECIVPFPAESFSWEGEAEGLEHACPPPPN